MPCMFRPPIAALLAFACASLAAMPLRVGGFVVAPLVLGEPGKPVRGALRDYLEREVVPSGVPLRWMPATSLPQALQGLRDGSLDVLLLASGEGVRTPGTTPSSWTYLHTQPHLAVRPDSPLTAVRSLDQLAGLEISWIAGPTLSPGLQRSGARWRRVDAATWQMASLRLLQAGSVDAAYFENPYSPRYMSNVLGIPIRLVRMPMPPRPVFMLYSLKADSAAVARFDKAAGRAFAGRRFRDFLDRYTTEGTAQGSALQR